MAAEERNTNFPSGPESCLEQGRAYTATVTTSSGLITIELLADAAPVTVNNFVFLARQNFYDGIAFHRVIDDFMIQAGDPTVPPTGAGGPGYTIPDELPSSDYIYVAGDVAMANTGAPGSGGSQFFIVTADAGVDWLDGRYSLFGRVQSGLSVAQTIAELDSQDGLGTPVTAVEIVDIAIEPES